MHVCMLYSSWVPGSVGGAESLRSQLGAEGWYLPAEGREWGQGSITLYPCPQRLCQDFVCVDGSI